MVRVTAFDQWVAENNIPDRFEYGKGWWDYVELIRRFAEKLPMRAVVLIVRGVSVALKFDLGALAKNQADFTCELEDEWEVAMLLRLVFHEA